MSLNSDGGTTGSNLSRNYSLNAGSSRERDCETLKQQLDKANGELITLRRRCDHAMKELDFYRTHHRASMNKMETGQELRYDVVTSEDYDSLRKRYEDLASAHSQTLAKLELAQDEANRTNKQYEELSQERNNALRDVSSLKQQLTKLYSQMDKVIRDCNKLRDTLQVAQQKYEDAVKDLKQAMTFRMKATKEVQRLTEERNATMTEYNLIMSERDTVHKEMEKLSDDLTQAYKKNKILEGDNKELLDEKKSLTYQMESLRREIASALHDRDKALKECNDLREKFGEYKANKEEHRDSLKSRLDSLSNQGENSQRKEIQVDSRSFSQRQRLDNLDQANQELENLRKSLDKTQIELTEAMQEAEVSKGRRDWAFSERDKIVLERESLRTLCDNMRKERDRAVSELAESLRESDAIKKHRNELVKEVKMLKEAWDMHMEKEAQLHQLRSMGGGHNHSHDSAIDSDIQEWETELLEIDLSGLKDNDLGFDISGRDDNYDNIYVTNVIKGSPADGKLRINDCITRVNNLDCGGGSLVTKRRILEAIRTSSPVVHLVIRRKRNFSNNGSTPSQPRTPPSFQSCNKVASWVHTAKLAAGCHGLSLEAGVYISKISEGSLAARDSSLVVGDRVLQINQKSMDGYESLREAIAILNNRDDRVNAITITTLKTTYLDPENNTNVFIPCQRYKKENRSSQTEDFAQYEYERRYVHHHQAPSIDYRTKSAQEKSSAWLKEKLDMVVRGRRHSKDRNHLLGEKKKHRKSSPNTLDLSNNLSPTNSFEQEQAIAELDLVISYHGDSNNSGTMKRSKRNHFAKEVQQQSAQEKNNGGTWPKTRATNIFTQHTNAMGTVVTRKKERPALSLLTKPPREQEYYHLERTTSPNNQMNRHSVYKSIENPQHSHNLPDSFEKLRSKHDYNNVNNRLSITSSRKSDDSLDYPISTSSRRTKTPSSSGGRYNNSDSERDNVSMMGHHPDINHPRIQSQLFPAPKVPYPFHPHPYPHPHLGSAVNFPSMGFSRDSIYFEPHYVHSPSPSVDATNYPLVAIRRTAGPMAPLGSMTSSNHSHFGGDSDMINLYETSGTFPRKKENPRFRIPSNPSVTSKNSAGKVSTGSIERTTSERGSPMPIFHVEVLNPDASSIKQQRNSVPEYCSWPHQHHKIGELRRVRIDKSNEPLGIQINCPESGGIFVSSVNENSLASRVGLQIGDQLLEVCGINMRNATYDLAASVLRQCGDSITMLVQYSPDKYLEFEGSGSCSGSSSNEEGDGEPTPCNSPKEIRKSNTMNLPSIVTNNGQTLIRSQTANLAAPNRQNGSSNNSSRTGGGGGGGGNNSDDEPRYLYIETLKTSNLGISLVGGNAVGIFIHSVQPDSLAYHAGLRTGDQILEYNMSDLRHATAEEAAYELAKPADKVTVLAHYRIDRYNEIKDKPGDSFYVRCGFDRSGSDLQDDLQLYFHKDEVLYVDNTMFRGNPGHWRAWKLDNEGHRHSCGIIPSKYKVEEELLLRRSSGDLESRGSTSARRSFFRRKKHQRSGSRDSKELASFSWYSDNGTLHEDLSLCSYQRVERLEYPNYRPVLVLGPLAECVLEKLVNDFPEKFKKVILEVRQISQAALDQEIAENLIIDYRRKGNYFECTTASAIRQTCASRHCMIDISISSVKKLHQQQIFPIVLLIKFKSTKQIKEIKDTRFSLDKVSGKAAKEMYEHCQKLEAEYRHQITAVIPAGVNIAHICTQVKAAIDTEHNKSQWVPLQ